MDCEKIKEIYSKTCVNLIEEPPKYVDKNTLEVNELQLINCLKIIPEISKLCKDSTDEKKFIN